MAYRFLLEVPQALVNDANAEISSVPDAQVVVVRNSHGLGFDEPYADMTIAAHSLQVIDSIYNWAGELGADRPESGVELGITLHNGQRVNLREVDRARLVAAIRQDQPWVERTLPKIGEHESYLGQPGPAAAGATAVVTSPVVTATGTETSAITVYGVDLVDADDVLSYRGSQWAVIEVTDIATPERLYRSLLGLNLVQRIRKEQDGTWRTMPDDYDHFRATRNQDVADVALMSNGDLKVALRNVGRGARIDYSQMTNRVSVQTDAASAARIKAQCLMRGFTLLGSTGPAFAFRDPFGVAWAVHPVG